MTIKLVVFDFDGVFTDGKIIFDNNGNALKHYNSKDGMGIFQLHQKGFQVGVISGTTLFDSQKGILRHLKITRQSLGSNDKLQILQKWCSELGIDVENVAYMGDDINDLIVMKEVGLTGCPNDAVREVKDITNFISSKNGGEGAIREFCDYICEIKNRYELKITAVIPCRNGSTRCKNKNMRKWGNTNLLQNKIDILKECKYIDYILVNTNDDEAINIAKQNDILYFKRDEILCIGDVPPAKVHVNLAENINTDIFLYNSPVSPFIKSETIDKIIDYWRKHPEYEIVSASTSIKNFIWENNKPYNFKINKGIVGTQELDNKYKFAAADSGLIGYKKDIIKNECLFGDGNKIFMYEINELESIDIDWNLDFVISESLLHRSFKNIELVENYMRNDKHIDTKLLDCTIRDTGYLNNWNWSYDTVKDFVYYMGEIGIEYCEIGFLKNQEYVEKGSGIWRNLIKDINIIRKLKNDTNTKCKIAVMVDINNLNEEYIDIDLVPNQKETSIDLVRVFVLIPLIIDKSIEVCKKLKNKGYTISLNVGSCSHLEYDDLSIIKKTVVDNSNSIDYLYFADSLGMLTPNEINKFMIDLKEVYPVKNGFHNHNNYGTVFGNLINLLNCNIDILDGTISGFGKNGGNANLEQLIMYLCLKDSYDLKLEPLLEFLEKIKDVDFGKDNKLNILSLKEMLRTTMNVHSSYLKPIINKNLPEIYEILKNLDYKKKKW